MKTLIVILIISSLLQSTILPINIVLIILICRSYIRDDKTNLILAFTFGFLVSFLSLKTLGFYSLLYLVIVQLTQILSKTRLTGNPLWILPVSFIMLTINNVASSLISNQSIHLMPQVLIETALSLPIFYFIKLWEERFIVRKEIKLKI